MRRIQRIASPVIAATLLTVLGIEAAEAVASQDSQYADIAMRDDETPVEPTVVEPSTAAPLPGPHSVGRTPGGGAVSPAGEATYSIPLELPPGTNGLTPVLSLEYRQRARGGDLGTGWTIGGGSAISRCARTLAQDGIAGPVTHTRTDRFCLDGARLVVVDGRDYGSAGAEYRTEIETFARIRSYGTAGTGPQYFVIEAPDGRLYEYGATADSRIDWGGVSATPRAWALNRVRDRSGNTLDFVYAEDATSGSYRLSRVRYNGNPGMGITPAHEVVFSYETRPPGDNDLGYVAGSSVLRSLRLSRVEVLHRDALIRRYELGYEPGLSTAGRSRLASVRECGRDAASCRPPTTLAWQDGRPGLGGQQSLSASLGAAAGIHESRRMWSGDVNGDGRDDLVWAGGATVPATLRFRLAASSGAMGGEVDTGIPVPSGAGAPFDYDADGYADALTISAGNRWLVVRGGPGGLGQAIDTGIAAGPIDFRGADLDGDGLSDLVFSESAGSWGNGLVVRVLYNTRGRGFVSSPVTLYEQGSATGYETAQGGDFLGRPGQRVDLDGDGREEVLMNEDASIARVAADRSISEPFGSAVSGGVAGDFNGDGCTDFAYPHYLGRWHVRFSGCSVAGSPGIEISGPAYGAGLRHILVFDWNSDARDDLLYIDATATWKVVLSAGDSLLATQDTGVPHGSPTAVAVGDLDGNSLPDLGSAYPAGLAYRLHAGTVPDLLHTVTDGLGLVTSFAYAPLSDPGLYARGSAVAWPLRNVADGRPVVAGVTVDDGAGSRHASSYSYTGLRRDLTGRGELGFERRIARESAPAGLSVEETYRQGFPFTGAVERVTLATASGEVLHDATTSWNELVLGSGAAARHHVYPSAQTTRSFDPRSGNGPVSTATLTAESVDPLSGLVTASSVQVTEGTAAGNPGATRTQRTQHLAVLNDTGSWCLGRPQATTTTASHSLPGGSPVTRSSSVDWDSSGCRPVRLQFEPGDPKWQVTVELAHDAFGNLTHRAVTGAGMTPRVDTLYWGEKGRFPERLTNALSQSALLSWDEGLGRVLAVTDPNGLRQTLEYDGFGTLVARTSPDGSRLQGTLQPCAGACDARGRARLSETETTSSGEILHSYMLDIDARGRAIRVVTRTAGGGQSQQAAEFDARGRLVRHYLPGWVGGQPGGWWDIDYDEQGRVTARTLHAADGRVERSIRHTWSGLTQTVIDARGGVTSSTSTAWGDTVEARDALGGLTRFESDPFGRLLGVRDANGTALAQLGYSPLGHKLSHVDADLGTWTLTRNALGEVALQRDAKGQETRYEYDLLGRMTRRIEPEGITVWTWGASASSRNIGRLASVTGPGYSESYGYDTLARLSRRVIASEGVHYYDYGYDAAGRLAKLTYPASVGGFRLSLGYEYDGRHAVRVRDLSSGGLLWDLTAVDAAGNVLDETRGGRLRVVSGYDPATGTLGYRQSFADSLVVQDLTYDWDGTGNLLARRDSGRDAAESFAYDPIGRLERVDRNGVLDLALRYDPDGNIAWKSDVCTSSTRCFSYDSTHRHAVTVAGSGRYGYDANGNMTSRKGSSIGWYSYNLPAIVNHGSSQARFWYGPARDRWKQVASGPEGTETTVYVGGLLEKVTRGTKITWRHYLPAPTGIAGIHLRQGDGSVPRTYLLAQDHLGGTDTIVDGTSGSVLLRESFDAFGRRRSGSGPGEPGAAEMSAIAAITRDGYAGHEHLDNVGLVHMGGRLYDPAIARFLSPDPVVTEPFNRQDLNRYAYAWNSPLSVTDPNGLEEVTCLHGPNGRCQGVTVTGYRDRPPMGLAYFAWRTGSNGQAVSAAERDPCGQDGSAQACSGQGSDDGWAAGDVEPPGLATGMAASLADIGRSGLNFIPGWYYSGAAAASFQGGNYLDAFLFYGAMAGDVFLLGRGLAMTQASRALIAPVNVVAAEHFNPVNPGPLSEHVASTFRSGSYARRMLSEPLVVYRLIGEGGNPTGRFWTTLEPKGALQSVIDLAIDQNWRNPATQVIRAELPSGTVIYEGATSAQRGLVGGARQIYIPRVDPGWLQ